ncbi:hypothetical protein CCICO_03815 [Corynebacterium ciconiae DSM 44920]|uniref:DUF6263 family protein n=1 Tax=Corynebacterium ciconiae TaxID=227319 RepID=UPI00036D6690|nr:DUF6263 family protein [Corynebacterium ciconiae]WKD60800.1 hypothetical protein CCICO_03815 [Corynebacterium ciconiae DSM 44920]
MTPSCRSNQSHRLFRTLLTLCTIGTLGITGCSADNPESDSAAVESDNAVELQLDSPKVTVIDPGAKDSATTLRYTASPDTPDETVSVVAYDGFEQHLAPLADIDRTAPAGGDVTSLTMPVDASLSGDDGRIELSLGSPTSSDISVNDTLASATGFSISLERNDRGITNSVRLAAPRDASDQARSLVESAVFTWLSLAVVFPDEPVGEGAQWSVNSRVPGENAMLQTITYTLTSIDGSTVTLNADTQRRSTLGALSAGDGHPELAVVSTESTSTGELTVDLSAIAGITGRNGVTTRVIYAEDGADDNQQAVVQDLTSAVEYSSK